MSYYYQPWEISFGIDGEPGLDFARNPITGLFDDQDMINALTKAMDDPISNFGPRNVPKCLKPVEILGIVQARKWEIGTLNDFRDFFGTPRHQTFGSVSKNAEIQDALRDLYEHADKIELYPGVFSKSDANMGVDPGPSDVDSALWSAIFSDAITLVRSDRFYTTDWNTNSLTSWGMKEVTPDNDTCKSSIFHRLIQRAFPEWYPYNSVQFFHPFYTRQTNARFAAQQGYAPEFRMSQKPTTSDQYGTPVFDVSDSVTQKPWKPIYLAEVKKISAILKDASNFVHPALKDSANFPTCFDFKGMFSSHNSEPKPILPALKEDTEAITGYFSDLMRYIIKQESISMNSSTLQIDATRDFAIPVVTKYVADFLGFGHLIRSAKYPKAPHSENEIYQHISNSNRWSATRYWFGTPKDNPMTKLGYEVAERVLKHEPSLPAAASKMLFVGLHAAYNSVLAFTSALKKFLEEMYDFANPQKNPHKQLSGRPKWVKAQELAFKDDEKSEQELRGLVEDVERRSIKLPLVRVALKIKKYKISEGNNLKVEKDHKVILDIKAAAKAGVEPKESDFLDHKSTAMDQFADYQPKRIAEVGVTAMIKIFAQMRNARRGHDAQGRVKKVKLDASAEGYTNYMAPMRIQRISKEVEMLGEPQIAEKIYTSKVLRPETETYLTAEWDEMVPFPNTWMIRFDGFGTSKYACEVNGALQEFGKLRELELYDDAPPYYQPRGASHTGGVFGDAAHVSSTPSSIPNGSANTKKIEIKDGAALLKPQTPAEHEPTIFTGCVYHGPVECVDLRGFSFHVDQ
ncbi:hypothetical protein BU16DRAFT_583709 [Lophium mytilinum]|uniref:Heme peroxidase n=1 Tax=Lophium mytilinum TaxID=390894 RepID=A0A6A6QLE1_9PEZI|nr:hypothetical protein BU16DRAFT_583709 [Lophium mytilinum]